jgi:hypothetical protein
MYLEQLLVIQLNKTASIVTGIEGSSPSLLKQAFCEHSNERFISIKGRYFLDLVNDCVPWT